MAIAAPNDFVPDSTTMNNENMVTQNEEVLTPHLAEALKEGLTLLSEFASLDSSGYQASFSSRSRLDSAATTSTVDSEAYHSVEEVDESSGSKNPFKRLEELQAQKQMQDTPIPTLWRAIHRLHSNLAILQENEGRHSLETRLLRDELKRSKRENGKLRKSAKALADQNTVLKQKLQEKRTLIKKAKNFFRDSTEQRKGLEEENAKIKLEAHEQFLQQSNRQRMNSCDSNFSDADALFFAGQESSSSMLPEGSDAVSLHSVHSGSSLLTGGGCAVRLQQEDRTGSWQTGEDSNCSHDLTLSNTSCDLPGGPLKHPASPRNPEEYKLSFPCGRPLSISIKMIPLSELPLPPKGMLTQDLLQEEVSIETKKSPRIHNLLKGPESNNNAKGNAFIVSGFDDDLEIKPTLGARIISIDGKAVKPEWKLRDFMAHVFHVVGPVDESMERTQAEEDSEVSKPCEVVAADDDASEVSSIGEKKNFDRNFSISFRNDALSKVHRDILNKKDGNTELLPESKNGKSEQRNFGLGFLKGLARQSGQPDCVGNAQDQVVDKQLETPSQEENDTEGKPCKTAPAKSKGRNKLFFWSGSEHTKSPSVDGVKDDELGCVSENQDGSGQGVDSTGESPSQCNEIESKDISTNQSTQSIATRGDEVKSEAEDTAGNEATPLAKGKSNALFFWDRSGRQSSTKSTGDEQEDLKIVEETNEVDQPQESLEPYSETNTNLSTDEEKDDKSRTEENESGLQLTIQDETRDVSLPKPSQMEEPKSSSKARFMAPFWRTSPKTDKSEVISHSQDDDDNESL